MHRGDQLYVPFTWIWPGPEDTAFFALTLSALCSPPLPLSLWHGTPPCSSHSCPTLLLVPPFARSEPPPYAVLPRCTLYGVPSPPFYLSDKAYLSVSPPKRIGPWSSFHPHGTTIHTHIRTHSLTLSHSSSSTQLCSAFLTLSSSLLSLLLTNSSGKPLPSYSVAPQRKHIPKKNGLITLLNQTQKTKHNPLPPPPPDYLPGSGTSPLLGSILI